MSGLSSGGGSANLGTLRAFLGLDTKGLDVGAAQARAKMGMLEKSMVGSSARMSSAMKSQVVAMGGMIAAAMGIRAVVNEFRKAVTVGASFEQQMTTVGGVMRATAEDMAMVTDVARLMGETTEWTATQAGQALYYLASAGFNARQSAEALPGVLNLATAANVDLARSADIAANSLHAFGLPIEELGRVNDVFVGTFTRTNVLMDDMAESMKYAAPAAKAFGYSIEELAGLIGTLGNAGIKGSMAGTQLSMAMLQAAKAAKKYGYESADLLDVLDAMTKEGKNTLEVLEGFGIRAGRAALVLKDMSGEARELQETLGGVGGEAKTLADKMRSTIGGAWRELISVMESARIDVFGVFRDGLIGMVKSTTQWVRDNKAEILSFIVGFRAGMKTIIDAIGPFVSSLGRFAGAIVSIFDTAADHIAGISGTIKDETKATSNALQMFSLASMGIAKPPDFSQWQIAWAELKATINNLTGIIVGSAKIISTVITELAYMIIHDLGWNVARALGDVGTALLSFANKDYINTIVYAKRAWGAIKDVKKDTVETFKWANKEIDKANTQYAKDWNPYYLNGAAMLAKEWYEEYQKNIKELGPIQIDIEAQMTAPTNLSTFSLASKQFSEVSLQDLSKGVHTKKDVGGGRGGDDTEGLKGLIDKQVQLYDKMLAQNGVARDELISIWNKYRIARKAQLDLTLKDLKGNATMTEDTLTQYEREMQEKWEGIFKAPVDDSAYRSRLDKETSFYESLLSNANLSSRAVVDVWEKYRAKREEQIKLEIKDLAGHSPEFIEIYKSLADNSLMMKQRELFEEQGSWLKTWAEKLSIDLRNIFADSFFMAFKGEWENLLNYLQNVFFRKLSEMAANSLMEMLNLSNIASPSLSFGGGASASGYSLYGAIAGGLNITKKHAAGAIVMRPEIAQIGEVPEAVIPLSKLSDPSFVNSIGGAGGNVNINMQINTPDVKSFRASQSQIMTQAAVAANRARRNL